MKSLIVAILCYWLSMSGPTEAVSNQVPQRKSEKEIYVRLSTDGRLPYDLETIGFAILGFSNAVLGRLVVVDESFHIIPALLEDAYWDFEDKRFVLRLRKNLRFHNGRRVSASDLEFSLIRFFLTKKRADPVAALKSIEGVEKLRPGEKYVPGRVSGIQVVSDTEIRIRLKSYSPGFLYRLTEGWLGIVPQEELKDDYVTWKTIPIGAGPYKVIELDRKDGWVRVQRIAPFPKEAPEYVTFFSNSNASPDVVGFTLENPLPNILRPDKRPDNYGYTALFFNHRSELGANRSFREAVAKAISRSDLVKEVSGVQPLYEILLSQFPGRLFPSVEPDSDPDLTEAKRLLAQIPQGLDKPIVAYSRHRSREPIPEEELIAARLKDQLQRLGLRVDYALSDDLTFAEDDKTAVFRIDDRGSGYSDALMTFRPFGEKGFLSAFYPQHNGGLEHLLTCAELAASRDDFSRALLDLSRRFDQDKYVLPLYQRQNLYWISQRLETVGAQYGVNFDPIEVRLKP